MSLELTSTYSVITCASCGMHFAVPVSFYDKRVEDHKFFYCPSGHSNYYPYKSDCEKAKEEVSRLESLVARKIAIIEQKNNSIQHLQNSQRALKAHLTIKKKKIEQLERK